MVTGSMIAVVFALFGVVTTVLMLVLGALGIVKMDQLRRTLPDGAGRTETPPETSPAPDPATDPVETLRKRYAEGELTDEQFERKVHRLLESEDGARDARERAFDLE